MARILVVEDSPDVRTLIRSLLEPAGNVVSTAPDGRAGVEAARREKPDLVIMDLSLPGLPGWEAARRIKSDPETSSITILAVTAPAMQGDRDRALAAGCDGALSKPIDEKSFADEVASWLGRRQAASSHRSGAAAGASAGDSPHGRVLVVDEDPEVAALIRADLEEDGHEVVLAHGLARAEGLMTPEKPFDLAIVDVRLDSDSGYDLAGELIARSGEYLPVLLVTAGAIDRERGYAAGADDFIAKPIERAELRARCRSLIRIGRAIREQGRAIRERSEAYEKLAELDRLKSDFLSTISHELRTPLNTIILLSNVIDREGTLPADETRRRHDLGVIRESAETLLRMINNILDLAKLEAGQRDLHPERLGLRSFLRETADMLEPQARVKGIELALEIAAGLPEAAVFDREKLSRVLINLLSNAIKNTAKGRVALRAAPWQDSVTFEVEDTGTGIPTHLIGVAFEPFRQIRTGSGESARGTGLGLPISKQLVEIMGGDLLLDSREGFGTRVTFTLPSLEEPPERETAEPVRATEVSERGSAKRPRRMLVVEDDRASRYGLKSLLESEGHEVFEASSLREASEALRETRPEVIFLDITLPDGDGAEWVRQLLRKGPLPFSVIALTGVTADADRRRIERSGVRTVLQKPVDVPLLWKALEDNRD
jgi:CheY-like chemotaxis protein